MEQKFYYYSHAACCNGAAGVMVADAGFVDTFLAVAAAQDEVDVGIVVVAAVEGKVVAAAVADAGGDDLFV